MKKAMFAIFKIIISRIINIENTEGTVKYIIPIYALIWTTCNSLFGNQRPPVKYSNLFKGNLIGLIIILSLYALLPKSIQFSRAIILGSSMTCLLISLFTRTTFKSLKIGLFKGFTDFHKNIALVGSLDEIQRTPDIFPILRGVIDRNKKNAQFY